MEDTIHGCSEGWMPSLPEHLCAQDRLLGLGQGPLATREL